MTTKEKLVFVFAALSLILVASCVLADFSYEERYDSYIRQYDTWVYDIDADDEDTRITLSHFWSSPRYSYDYETGSDFAFDYAPATPRYLSNVIQLSSPPTYSYNAGKELISSFGTGGYYRHYGYSGNSWGGHSRYTTNYW